MPWSRGSPGIWEQALRREAGRLKCALDTANRAVGDSREVTRQQDGNVGEGAPAQLTGRETEA